VAGKTTLRPAGASATASRLAGAPLLAAAGRRAGARIQQMSVTAREHSAADTVAGYMAAAAIFFSLIGIVYKPVRLLPAAMLVALVAAGIGGRHRRLAAAAVATCALAWVVGMTVAVLTENDLY
jgi:hypothetical protein